MNDKIKHYFRQIRHSTKRTMDFFLGFLGFAIVRSGNEFLDSKITIAAAKAKGMKINEYVESTTDDERKKGRRDRVIKKMAEVGVFEGLESVCEIGPGTGRYMEKVIEVAKPRVYEIYETHVGWRDYLKSEYSNEPACAVRAINANGRTLSETTDKSCDLVHVHAVFVYLPLLQCLTYVKEAFRVSKSGGFVVLDFIPSETFDKKIADAWLASPHKWPVLIPEKLLREMASQEGFSVQESFEEVYGESFVKYLIFKRN